MSGKPITPLVSVMINDHCVGYLIRRGRQGIDPQYEAFNANDVSLGRFAEGSDAIAAVMKGTTNASNDA